MNVKKTFLHGELDEEIYKQQPKGFVEKGKESLLSRLKKSLYGLKQAPLQSSKKFQKTQADHYVFVKKYDEGDFLILLLYVDDMLIVRQDTRKIEKLKKAVGKSFAMKDLGLAKQILGMHIVRDRTKKVLWLSRKKYVTKILERFNMSKQSKSALYCRKTPG